MSSVGASPEIEDDTQVPLRCKVGDLLPRYATVAKESRALKWVDVPHHIARDLPVSLPPDLISDVDGDASPGQWTFIPDTSMYDGIFAPSRARGRGIYCKKCGRFMKITNKHDMDKHVRAAIHKDGTLEIRELANTRRYRFAQGLEMVAFGDLPYDAVETPQWRALAGVEGLAAPSARNAANMLHEARVAFEEDIKTQMTQGPTKSVSLQIDAWKQKHMRRRWIGYLVSVTTSNAQPIRAFLRLEHFTKNSETGRVLAEGVLRFCRDYGIRPDAVISDTASNMLAAADIVQNHYAIGGHEVNVMPCFCHLLSLCCKAFLKGADDPAKMGLVSQMRSVHRFFFSGSAFPAFLEELGSPRISASTMIDVRWEWVNIQSTRLTCW